MVLVIVFKTAFQFVKIYTAQILCRQAVQKFISIWSIQIILGDNSI